MPPSHNLFDTSSRGIISEHRDNYDSFWCIAQTPMHHYSASAENYLFRARLQTAIHSHTPPEPIASPLSKSKEAGIMGLYSSLTDR